MRCISVLDLSIVFWQNSRHDIAIYYLCGHDLGTCGATQVEKRLLFACVAHVADIRRLVGRRRRSVVRGSPLAKRRFANICDDCRECGCPERLASLDKEMMKDLERGPGVGGRAPGKR